MIESLHMQLRKIIKNRGHFPSDEAAIKLLCSLYEQLQWKVAMNQVRCAVR